MLLHLLGQNKSWSWYRFWRHNWNDFVSSREVCITIMYISV
jgi:hypothetical protein